MRGFFLHKVIFLFQDSLFGFWQFNCNVSRCGSLCVSYLGVCWTSWMCILMHILGKFSRYLVSFDHYSAPFSLPSGTPTCIQDTWRHTYWCPRSRWGSVHISSSFFALCSTAWIISVDLTASLPNLSYAGSHLLLILSNEYLTAVNFSTSEFLFAF